MWTKEQRKLHQKGDCTPDSEHRLTKHLGRTQDGRPGVHTEHGLLALKLGPRPLARRVGVGSGAAHVDQVVHLHLEAELGDGPGNVDVGLPHARGHLVIKEGELVGVLEGLGVVVLPDEVHDDVGVGDDIRHGLLVAAGVVGEPGAAELEARAEVTICELVAAGADVR